MFNLPGDLVEEILCRVPATSLSQLRYTCKQWNNLCNNRTFTRKHLDKAPKQYFLLLMSKHDKVCLMSVNFCGVPSIEIKGEYGLTNPQANFEIYAVSHCEGLLLCNDRKYSRIVVWNPCTGQTNWIQPRNRGSFALGSYQDKNYGGNSYKILSCPGSNKKEFEIYEINTKVWKTLDVTLDCELEHVDHSKSLKGKTCWFASDENEEQRGMFLVSFDYTTEVFERLLPPCQCLYHKAFSLSVVREEKLSVLLIHGDASRTEIWLTNKIDDTKVVSWSKFLTVDLKAQHCIWGVPKFLVDEENKFIVVCQFLLGSDLMKQVAYIAGEDNKVKQVCSGPVSSFLSLSYYVPSLGCY
ncbi:hypothetical protein CARUB_v10025542mg [Capsella rubella]|uniref:F-box domain-containing protein n=1 Tax=Capsella rubella TaxID=81985 RepID=R0HYU9_9BRAS|nr:probable F-box protein At5g47300 [Capsella rubella]EOA29268.1 hypothetical protein CARUB_v10025542mg [Capsella rubella]